MARRNQHVVPHGSGWAVRGSCSRRASSIHPSQTAAIDAARKIAQNQRTELVVHGRDGKISDRDSFRSDPRPPKG